MNVDMSGEPVLGTRKALGVIAFAFMFSFLLLAAKIIISAYGLTAAQWGIIGLIALLCSILVAAKLNTKTNPYAQN